MWRGKVLGSVRFCRRIPLRNHTDSLLHTGQLSRPAILSVLLKDVAVSPEQYDAPISCGTLLRQSSMHVYKSLRLVPNAG